MNHTVLLVDDDENTLRSFARTLSQQPYKLYTARSGEEAMLILKTRAINVLVSDECMPGMSGNELLAWVVENCPHVISILLTGRATTEIAIRAINDGAVYQFLTKPCDGFRLAISISKALEHGDFLKEACRASG